MEWIGSLYFYLFGALALGSAIGCVSAKSPVRGAMGLMLMIVSIAMLFLQLSAHFLAVIQLIVYAGAVVVLFVFVTMLLGPDATGRQDSRGIIPRAIGGGLFGLTALGGLLLCSRALMAGGGLPVPADTPADFGTIDAVGRELFTRGLAPFELSSALLMVAVLGAVAVAKGGKGAES